ARHFRDLVGDAVPCTAAKPPTERRRRTSSTCSTVAGSRGLSRRHVYRTLTAVDSAVEAVIDSVNGVGSADHQAAQRLAGSARHADPHVHQQARPRRPLCRSSRSTRSRRCCRSSARR
ncbi:hypothetical protein ACTMU2_27655, partial [Cupriavidus basilensis]